MLPQVPPIIIAMTKNKSLCEKFDLSSVTGIFTGAAPLGQETADDLLKQYPSWKIRQGFGLWQLPIPTGYIHLHYHQA